MSEAHRPPRPELTPGLVGNYHWDLVRDEWWWSAELHAIHGVARDVSPSTELLLRLTQPEDREQVVDVLRMARRTAEPFSCELRIRRADDGRERRVAMVGEVSQDEQGAAQAIHGFFIDVTDAPGGLVRESLEAENARLREELASLRAQLYQSGEGSGLLRIAPPPEPSVVVLSGEIDLASRIPFTRAVQNAIGNAHGDVYLDLSDVVFIDVGGVEVLLNAAAAMPEGRRLVVLEPRHGLRRLLSVLRLSPPTNLVLVRGRSGFSE